MSLIGIDLNASRARAVSGPRRQAAGLLRLEGGGCDLPLALSLEERLPTVGRPGAALARKAPDLACLDFLPHLGDGTVWAAGRHTLDASAALGLVLDDLRRRVPRSAGAALALPGYLNDHQIALVRRLAEKARWPLLGSVPAPLAAALAALGEGGEESLLPGWAGRALVLDVDGHALTCASVEVDDYQVSLRHVHVARQLGRGAWLRRLLDGVAHACVRLSRRDPRESADAEQALYDQLAHFVDHGGGAGPVLLHAQAGAWYQQLMLHPDELAALVAPLVRQALAEVAGFLTTADLGMPAAVVLTSQAGRLPGLT